MSHPATSSPNRAACRCSTGPMAGRLARDGVLLDARTSERYRGESELLDPVAGHIPGAVNSPTADNVDASGRFRTAEELRKRFAGLGVTEAVEVGAYCGSGVSAAHEVLALELAGVRAALYVGSWSDWVSDPDRPVATGRARAGSSPAHRDSSVRCTAGDADPARRDDPGRPAPVPGAGRDRRTLTRPARPPSPRNWPKSSVRRAGW